MSEAENLGNFFKENKKLVKEYIETRLEIYRLKAIKTISKTAGYFIWIIISLFLVFLLVTFAALVLGFWLSNLTGSYVAGFGITTLVILILIVVLALLRKTLFVNPIIRAVIDRANDDSEIETDED
jgi:lipopolysaccharide export LptBFGC system permease protein LptF